MITDPRRHTVRQVEMIMGMPISLALRGRHTNSRTATDAWSAVVAQLQQVDRIFSTYRDDSYVNRLDRGELALADCPPEVAEVIMIGERAAERSGGAFSIFLPTPDGPRFDPSGVVKGWAVERAARLLEGLEDTDFCLSAGGDLVCHVAGADSPTWRIGIENPKDPRGTIGVVPVRNGAVATSGTAHRGEHIVDARTGTTPSGVASVTVIGDSLTAVDVDATTAYALGDGGIGWLAEQPGRLAFVVRPDGSSVAIDHRNNAVQVIDHKPALSLS